MSTLRINWSTDGTTMPSLDFRLLSRWIEGVAEKYGKVCGQLSYCFCDDAKILSVNREFLNHDYYTDIITFDYSNGKKISGDILISLDTVSTNAHKYHQLFDVELKRVIIHGILHLCGIKDKEPGERETMERAENESLEALKLLQEYLKG